MELNGQIHNGGSLNGSFGYDSGDYELLSNKPQINGVTLTGNKTSADLHIEGGTDDYNDLDNKPMINGVQLSGNMTPEDLGLAEIIFPDDPTLFLNGSGNFEVPDYFSGDYDDLTDKPQINGVQLSGNKSTSDLLIDYDDLSGRPQINGSTLTGNKTAADLGLEPEINYPGDATQYLNGEGNFTTPDYFSGDYDHLTDKPQINGVTLSGNQSSEDLNIYTPSTIGEEAAAAAINFTTEGAYNILHSITDFEYTQNLNGYDKPWAAGAGKNILPLILDDIKSINTAGIWADNEYTINGVKYTILLNEGNNIIGIEANGLATANADLSIVTLFNPTEDVYFNGCPSGGSGSTYQFYVSGRRGDYGSGSYLNTGESGRPYLRIFSGYNAEAVLFEPMIRSQTESDPTFEPYTNISPIIGLGSSTITISPNNDPGDGKSITIDFGAAHYKGTVDASTGKIIEEYGYIASYAGETLPGEWVSDRDLYDPNNPNTPTTGAMVIYELTDPTEAYTQRVVIITYVGDNYMWSNTGDISAVYAIKINDPIIEYLLNNR